MASLPLCQPSPVAPKLRDTLDRDLPAVLAIEADPDVAPWISAWPLERHRRAICDADEAHMVFCERQEIVGFLLLAGLLVPERSVELRRIALSPRGEGLGAPALDLALGYAFDVLGAPAVWLDVLPTNTRALRLYRRAGLLDDGLIENAHLLPDGSSAPLRLMSIRVEDWSPAPEHR
jgi:diamine N-acetyltransferase